MRIKTKFKAIWNKAVARRPAEAGLKPFPGSSLLRWVVLNSRGTPLYEGKPSTQAMRVAAGGKSDSYVFEFDKEAPFIAIVVHPNRTFQFSQADWVTWERFHGPQNAAQYYQRIIGGKAGAGI